MQGAIVVIVFTAFLIVVSPAFASSYRPFYEKGACKGRLKFWLCPLAWPFLITMEVLATLSVTAVDHLPKLIEWVDGIKVDGKRSRRKVIKIHGELHHHHGGANAKVHPLGMGMGMGAGGHDMDKVKEKIKLLRQGGNEFSEADIQIMMHQPIKQTRRTFEARARHRLEDHIKHLREEQRIVWRIGATRSKTSCA